MYLANCRNTGNEWNGSRMLEVQRDSNKEKL